MVLAVAEVVLPVVVVVMGVMDVLKVVTVVEEVAVEGDGATAASSAIQAD